MDENAQHRLCGASRQTHGDFRGRGWPGANAAGEGVPLDGASLPALKPVGDSLHASPRRSALTRGPPYQMRDLVPQAQPAKPG